MSQTLDPLPNNDNNLLCCYVNATSRIQIARITNIPNWYFERVVFPGQRLVFEADPKAILEIHCGMMASAILSDTIPCTKLSLPKTKHEPKETRKIGDISQEKGDSPNTNIADISASVGIAV